MLTGSGAANPSASVAAWLAAAPTDERFADVLAAAWTADQRTPVLPELAEARARVLRGTDVEAGVNALEGGAFDAGVRLGVALANAWPDRAAPDEAWPDRALALLAAEDRLEQPRLVLDLGDLPCDARVEPAQLNAPAAARALEMMAFAGGDEPIDGYASILDRAAFMAAGGAELVARGSAGQQRLDRILAALAGRVELRDVAGKVLDLEDEVANASSDVAEWAGRLGWALARTQLGVPLDPGDETMLTTWAAAAVAFVLKASSPA